MKKPKCSSCGKRPTKTKFKPEPWFEKIEMDARIKFASEGTCFMTKVYTCGCGSIGFRPIEISG